MRPWLLYVLGIPGAGKTTVMRAALGPWNRVLRTDPFAHELLVESDSITLATGRRSGRVIGAHLGYDRHPFGGTDTLPMNVQPRVIEWLATAPHPVIVGEGDRLGNAKFLDAAAKFCDVTTVLLDCDPDRAARRRQDRSGRVQNPSWVAGRETKVTNLAARADVVLDGNTSLLLLAHRLHHIIAERIEEETA